MSVHVSSSMNQPSVYKLLLSLPSYRKSMVYYYEGQSQGYVYKICLKVLAGALNVSYYFGIRTR